MLVVGGGNESWFRVLQIHLIKIYINKPNPFNLVGYASYMMLCLLYIYKQEQIYKMHATSETSYVYVYN